MNASTGLACLCLSLTFIAPAFCGPPAALVGKWQLPPYAPGRSSIYDFKADGTLTASLRHGTTVTPIKRWNGKPLIVRYAVSGNRLTIFYPEPHAHIDAALFKIRGDKMTSKVLMFNSRPVRGSMYGSTLTRFKG